MLAKTFKKLASTLAVAALFSSLAIPQTANSAETQYFPIASSRVGPYSAMGTGYYGAQIDYLNYVNMTGGVNGVMLTWQNVKLSITQLKQLSVISGLLEKDGQRIVVFDTLGNTRSIRSYQPYG